MTNCDSAVEAGISRQGAFDLKLPAPKLLAEQEELGIVRAAYARSPESQSVRYALASLLFRLDAFDELTALLDRWHMEEYRFVLLQIGAQQALRHAAADLRADALCLRLLERVEANTERAELHFLLARSRLRADDFDAARGYLEAALAADPSHHAAYRTLALLDLEQGHAVRVAGYAAARLARGDRSSDVIASLTCAQAQLGEIAQARQTQGLDHFLAQLEPAPPPGWATLQAFNQELAAELNEHASLRFGRYGHSSRRTWHVPQPDLARARMFPVFQSMLQREVEAYCQRLPALDHPFLQARPAIGALQNWCVITEGEGHETWHLHPGWLSGTYYVQVPEHIAQGQGREGCIAFGLPEQTASEENIRHFGEVLVRPRSGLLVLFPSHVFHRTYPHQGQGRRICCAFDIAPAQGPA